MTVVTNVNFRRLIKIPGRHRVEKGLCLKVVDGEGRTYWIARYRFDGVERETSLGSAYDISLAEARNRHISLRSEVKVNKVDPVASKRNARRLAWAAPSGAPTFGAAAEAFLDRQQRKAVWREPKLCLRWRNALMGLPMGFRDLPADKIDAKAVYAVLEPIWDTKPETARRLRGRIEAVLEYAREPDDSRPNPAAWSGWLKTKLGESAKIKIDRKTGERVPTGHHPALPWQDVPTLVEKLRAMGSTAAVALEFLILTAARTSEVIGMPFEEVGDLDALKPVWTVPKERMKMSRDHQVPLSARAVKILSEQRARRSASSFGLHPYVFAGDRPRKPLTNMAMAMVLRRLKIDVTVHGMRAAFRSWCADTGVAFELAEAALAHSSSSIVAAYQRSALTERRRPVMEAWAWYSAGEEASGEVVTLHKVAVE
jgi:integrase